MNRIIPAGCLAALFLAGCNSPSQHTPVPRNYGAASDVAVTRHTQYTLWDKGVFSGQLPVSTGSHLLTANSDRLSFDWEGDAIELLNELARVRGMQFNYNGVRLPPIHHRAPPPAVTSQPSRPGYDVFQYVETY